MIQTQIGKIILDKNSFAIVSHTSPDGDSMGSMLAVYNQLLSMGKNADVFVEEDLPMKYSFLSGFGSIKKYSISNKSYECVFVLDCGDIDRLGLCKDVLNRADVVINIDHHISNTLFGHLNLVDSNASSVGEIIYQLFKVNGYHISKEIAGCLYTSIVSDTGGFKYSNTTSITLSIVGDLINTNIDFSDIYNKIFNVKTLSQIKLMSKVTSTLELHFDNRVSILILTENMLKECNANEDDASEFINIGRDIEEVEVAILIKEKNINSCRVSLRSKKYVDVAKIASMFGGGGHIRAAGCTIEGNIDDVKESLLTILKNYFNAVI
ncbi:hypothetical protein Q428_09120 [Fervidicella metallireducens AeB]|uniref:1-pyrroline-5-carboxylate dehydrogenase n=1 Tax=Fervidicella metallireducens AeB TaxID=1403537 RepID=A0A017RUA4_9CLOT|nr:bifunctional oligoribonuclease/PAP phosphatase NrnA [Fervidicella metallireducens]EYE88181.1 hypothetical protein Q428_09120 [Fervidicella metallireducens AeB]